MEPKIVPREVGKCPECGGALEVEVVEWDAETGVPTIGGLSIGCREESLNEEAEHHRHWQSDWQDAIDEVSHWARENIRVPINK